MNCIMAYQNLRGCRNPTINDVVKKLIFWQKENQIPIEIVYVNTHSNPADAPSREILIDEVNVTHDFLRYIFIKTTTLFMMVFSDS